MSDSIPNPDPAAALPAHRPFPVTRLLYAFGFGIVAHFVFWTVVMVAIVQFVMIAINGRTNDELRTFSANLSQYLAELAGFIAFVRDDMPFPIGPFPRQG